MKNASTLDMLALALVIIGGLNWGLVGLLNLDLVQLILGSIPMLAQIVYIVVGLAALYMIYFAVKE
ncbi:DUF378 domain-containing protein [Candidatus Micrarchaeota archaeon]|nr:DUF378 domain-containing protein [Candidatus Micrarchaeota archaeon]